MWDGKWCIGVDEDAKLEDDTDHGDRVELFPVKQIMRVQRKIWWLGVVISDNDDRILGDLQRVEL